MHSARIFLPNYLCPYFVSENGYGFYLVIWVPGLKKSDSDETLVLDEV